MAKKSPASPRSSFRFTSAPRQRRRNLLHPPPNPLGLPQQTSCQARRNKLGCPSTLPSSTMPVYRYCSFLWPPAYSTPASSPSRHSLLIPEWFAHNVPIGVSLSLLLVHPASRPLLRLAHSRPCDALLRPSPDPALPHEHLRYCRLQLPPCTHSPPRPCIGAASRSHAVVVPAPPLTASFPTIYYLPSILRTLHLSRYAAPAFISRLSSYRTIRCVLIIMAYAFHNLRLVRAS